MRESGDGDPVRCPTVTPFFNVHHDNQHYLRPPSDLGVGNRGSSRLPWRCGPREPHCSLGGLNQAGSTSMFVDCNPHGVSSRWLRVIFEREGRVDDVLISKKI